MNLSDEYVRRLEREIADAKRERETHRTEEAKLRLLMQQIPAVVWTTDCDLRVTSLTGAGLANSNIDPKNVTGKTVSEFLETLDPGFVAPVALHRAVEGESVEAALPFRGRMFQVYVEPLRNERGEITGTLGVGLDVTERQRADEALMVSHARVAGIVGISEDAIISIDERQRISLFNRGAERIFGYNADEVLGRPLDVLLPERIAGSHHRHVREFSGSADALRPMAERGEIYGRRKDGTEFPAEASISKFEVAGEKILNVRLRDITERKRFEAELRARARQQAAVAEIGRYALAGAEISALMQRACELVAATLEVQFCKVLELLDGGSKLLLRAGVGWKEGLVGHATLSSGTGSHAGYTLLSTGPVIIEDLANETRFTEPLLRDHSVVSGLSVIIRTKEGPFGVLGAHAKTRRAFTQDDINFLEAVANVLAAAIERARTEEELRRSNETLRVVNQAAPVALWALDLEGQVQFWNPEAERMFGWSEGEVLRQALPTIPDGRQELEAIMARHRRGDEFRGVETRRRKKDGTLIDVSLWSSPLRDGSGKIRGALVAAADITERKRLEEQLRQSQKLESVGLLAGGVAHDFNNLLTGIMGNVSLALESLDHPNPARVLLENSLRASERAADLIRQLLAYSGKGKFIIKRVDISELVREILPLVKTSVPKKVQVGLDLGDGLPPVEGDPGQLQQLIMNLVINGAEAVGEEKAGAVIVRTRLQEMSESDLRANALDGLAPGAYVVLEVRDTGSGMDEKTVRQIFDPFFTTKFTGRGLGLAAVSGIVRGHKGGIKVFSTPGRGSTFKILLPAAQGLAQSPGTQRTAGQLHGAGTVLVVDDEEVVRRIAKGTLERYGYNVVLAENGRQAVEILQKKPEAIDIVLLDMSMPLMSGEETLERLREIAPNLPAIVSSGFNETEAVRRFTGLGIAGFLQKPYTAARLAEKIRAAAPPKTMASGTGARKTG